MSNPIPYTKEYYEVFEKSKNLESNLRETQFTENCRLNYGSYHNGKFKYTKC